MRRLNNKGQSINMLLTGGIGVVVFMFLMGFLALTADKTQTAADSSSASVNSTFAAITSGTEDGADMGKIALFAIPAIFVLGLFIGLGRLA